MRLPVTSANSEDGIWRRFADVAIDHALAAGEELVVRGARAVAGDDAESKRLPGLVILPEKVGDEDVFRDVLVAFEQHGSALPRWLDPRPDAANGALKQSGYVGNPRQLLRLKAARVAADSPADVLVVSARAARSACATWCEERAAEEPAAKLLPRHVDDPQYEAFIALRGGRAVAAAGLQIRGQTGWIGDVFVRHEARRAGLATLLIGRACDLAARAQLTEIYTVIHPTDMAARRLSDRTGFALIRNFSEWTSAGEDQAPSAERQ